jgi:peptidoglycan/xylan/chitin deacetylase (PgdA/CDA1 family)
MDALYFTGAHKIMRPLVGGVGAILMLHHVRPARPQAFQPNQLLEITPEFLKTVIRSVRRSGIDLVSLDEVHRRLTERDFRRRFAAVTFDDGYRDNKIFAYPILEEYDVPFAIYVPTSFPDRLGQLWWVALEAVIAQNASVALRMDGADTRFACATLAEKRATYSALYAWLRARPEEAEILGVVRDLAARYRVDMTAICDELCMTWEEIAALARDKLVTIGAHTVNHVILSKWSDAVARSELKMGRAVLEAALGTLPRHLAYPYGDRSAVGPREFKIAAELGYLTAVTTRPGVLFAAHREHLTALPRISLNGEFQRGRYAQVLLSGAGTALWNRFRRLDVA